MWWTKPSCHASVDLLVDLCADYAFGDSEIEIGLKSEPKLGRNTEVFAQSQRGVGADSACPVHNSADAAGWNRDFPGESIDTDVLYPNERITHDDELHWTRPAQNWNFMCADCHSTGLRKNYDPVANRFQT